MKQKTIAILFSGGTDSTATAVYYLQKGYTAHLLTFDNGAEKWLDYAEYKADRIKKQFPDQCIWSLRDSTYFFHELAIGKLVEDVRKFGNLICCGCKLAMLVEAIRYCKKNGITVLADGFKKAQDFYPEQTPDYMIPADAFAHKYGIKYVHPFYEDEALNPDAITLGGGVPPSPIQPYCLFGFYPVRDKRFIRPYVKSKLPAMKKYLDRMLSYGKNR